MTKRLLHFSVGPVQSFIADSRRTRDIWASSFLISWLSGKAMSALDQAENRIVFPKVENNDLFNAIKGLPHNDPYIGSLPNRFKADVTGIENSGQLCEEALRSAWKELCDKVYRKFIEPSEEMGKNTRAIWERHTQCFWKTHWVVGEDPGDGSDGQWLDRRKNIPTADFFSTEGGDLCRLMGSYQEISGYDRIRERDDQETFWKHISNGPLGEHDLDPTEYLSSIALIKRAFPIVAQEILGWQPANDQFNIRHWPSVSYISALPWLRLAEATPLRDRNEYWSNIQDKVQGGFMGETHSTMFNFPTDGLFKVDGHLLHQDGINSWPEELLKGENGLHKTTNKQSLIRSLKSLQKSVGCQASEYYAVLVMDGDSLGSKIHNHSDTIKTALDDFAKMVQGYFSREKPHKFTRDGILIYAGGDDVLALLPIDKALTIAKDIRGLYQKAFEKTKSPDSNQFTISASLILSQYKIPFRLTLKHAHEYIDNVAKDKNGRDSIAVAVLKPNGITFDWVSCWEMNDSPVSALQSLAESEFSNNENRKTKFSGSFLYNLRERYLALITGPAAVNEFQNDLLKAVFMADFKRQPGKSKTPTDDVSTAIDLLMKIGLPLKRSADGRIEQSTNYNFDAILLARFLSQEFCTDPSLNNKSADSS